MMSKTKENGCQHSPTGCNNHQKEAQLLSVVVESVRSLTSNLFCLDLTGFPDGFHFKAGQFLHVRTSESIYPLLRRPISIQSYTHGTLTLLIREVGTGTRALHDLIPGNHLNVLGPLGTGFSSIGPDEKVLLVGGGVGAAPMIACCEAAAPDAQISFCLGMANRHEIESLMNSPITHPGVTVYPSTDDGSLGHSGYCTDVAASLLKEKRFDRIHTCGPWIMMKKTVDLARAANIPVEVSLEVQMGCGLGACLACVYETPEGEFIRSCLEGPVVDGKRVQWERTAS
jgi:dihydroorotate dehydrogenase electron transfer subunit